MESGAFVSRILSNAPKSTAQISAPSFTKGHGAMKAGAFVSRILSDAPKSKAQISAPWVSFSDSEITGILWRTRFWVKRFGLGCGITHFCQGVYRWVVLLKVILKSARVPASEIVSAVAGKSESISLYTEVTNFSSPMSNSLEPVTK